ncbi:MAG TPA: GyrI-like domain-containing protein, partial [Chloroflexota bacterium]
EREEAFSTPTERETQFTVEIQELQPQVVAGIRAIATQAEIGATFRELLPEIVEYLREIGVSPVGAPYARYFHVGADRVDMEVGIAIDRPIDGNARVEPGELPGGEAATTVHVGSYDGLTEAYDALVAWIEEEGRVRTGLPWEVYAMDPEHVPEPDEWQTRIFWPLL